MTLFMSAYVGGALTILAPCILPVVPFAFARVDQPFSRNGLPLLVGMAATFERLVPTPVTAPPTPVATSMPASSIEGSRFLKVQARPDTPVLPSEGPMPPIVGAVEWLNSPPLSAQQWRGKVVLIDFWTFGCINCRNALPHVREWHRNYKDQGLVVIGVHTPEFAYEKNIANVKRALSDLDLSFPVAVDNDFAIWRSFQNNYWPAHYFIDAKGQIRFHHFGEGEYDKSERVIQQLIEEARKDTRPL